MAENKEELNKNDVNVDIENNKENEIPKEEIKDKVEKEEEIKNDEKEISEKTEKIIWYAGGEFRWPRLIGGMVGMGERDNGQHDQVRFVDFGVGTCMLIRASVFETIGLLDEDFFFYHEDVDFSLRTKKAGFKILYQPESTIIHNVGNLTIEEKKRKTFLEAQSRIIFFKKHISGLSVLLVILFETFRLIRKIFPCLEANSMESGLVEQSGY